MLTQYFVFLCSLLADCSDAAMTFLFLNSIFELSLGVFNQIILKNSYEEMGNQFGYYPFVR